MLNMKMHAEEGIPDDLQENSLTSTINNNNITMYLLFLLIAVGTLQISSQGRLDAVQSLL